MFPSVTLIIRPLELASQLQLPPPLRAPICIPARDSDNKYETSPTAKLRQNNSVSHRGGREEGWREDGEGHWGRERQTLPSLTPHKMTRERERERESNSRPLKIPQIAGAEPISPFPQLPFKLLRLMRCDMQHRRKKCEFFGRYAKEAEFVRNDMRAFVLVGRISYRHSRSSETRARKRIGTLRTPEERSREKSRQILKFARRKQERRARRGHIRSLSREAAGRH